MQSASKREWIETLNPVKVAEREDVCTLLVPIGKNNLEEHNCSNYIVRSREERRCDKVRRVT